MKITIKLIIRIFLFVFLAFEIQGKPADQISHYDSFALDSTIVVNDGYNYSTDSLAIIKILRFNNLPLPKSIDSMSAVINGRIAKLELSGILPVLPPEIGNLTALQFLAFYSNYIDSIPSEIGNLSQLTELHIFADKIRTIPATIGKLINLKSLKIYSLSLYEIPSTIGNLVNLQILDLSNSLYLRELPKEIGNLSNMTFFRVAYTPLKRLPPEIGKLTKLKHLDLSCDSLESLPNELGSCKALSTIFINVNPKLRNLPDSIVNLPNCHIWVDEDLRCLSLSCPIRSWLDIHTNAPGYWTTPTNCPLPMVAPCNTSASITPFQFQKKPTVNKQDQIIRIYDFKGRLIQSGRSGHLTKGIPTGAYLIGNSKEGTILSQKKLIVH